MMENLLSINGKWYYQTRNLLILNSKDHETNQIKFISSLKGNFQLCLQGYPFTRHRVSAGTTYWRCVQFHPLGCKARVRTKFNGKQLEIVDSNHNHGIQTERRKKGTLKVFYEHKKKQKVLKNK